MSKSYLAIETPEKCGKCPLMKIDNKLGEAWTRCFNDKLVLREEKRGDCPLQPFPDKIDIEAMYKMADWGGGYNACIDEMLGETKVTYEKLVESGKAEWYGKKADLQSNIQ